ncbi:MAG: ABC transporter permease [Planctomycetes bacterium]|nr:ABC transporter permease [Planctomycetota bacterium]
MFNFKLVRRYLGKHLVRSLLTVASLMVALFLLCLLQAIVVSLDAGVRGAKRDRLIVQSAVSLFVDLPLNYQQKIGAVDGVESICKWQYFGGHFQDDEKGYFAQFATDFDTLFACYPEIEVVEGSKEALLADRTACIVGKSLADRLGWKLGDSIPLEATFFAKPDGSAWDFKLAATYRPTSTAMDGGMMFFRWDYLEETVKATRGETPGTGTYVFRTRAGADQAPIAATVEALFENGPQRVSCSTEAAFQAQFVSMYGNLPFFVSAIGGGVLVAIVLACINTMLMAFREQLHDAGILKAVGFTDGSVATLMLAQSLVLCGIGGFAGIGLAKLTEPVMQLMLTRFGVPYEVPAETVALASALTISIGLVAGVVPAWRARQLRVVEALRSVE